ncbi:hypothetical protein LZ906_017865 (plasmid) [Paraclostridium ghonii]|uniref:hypothetical protein n=1 Tax=Paraclostridium ghonii TaxID=29358 RepID=UPI00202D0D14|nr:hypothetical protein [Paeniclostridium ghonii]MCM0167413.1 hypothetical protein [Paeniclostridium ghonii]
MDNQILDLLLEMKNDINEMRKEFNSKLDKLDFQMKDGFDTLEILSENNSNEINKLKVKVTKVENRLKEMDTLN